MLLLVCLCFLAVSCDCNRDAGKEQKQDAGPGQGILRTARIVFSSGNVRVKKSGSMEWLPARRDMELSIDDKVRTLRDSFANIEFESGGLLRVGPESLVVVTDLRLEPVDQARRYTFTLMEGKVEAELSALEKGASEFKIRTSSAETSLLHREVAFQ
jgi:hypothetical protein